MLLFFVVIGRRKAFDCLNQSFHFSRGEAVVTQFKAPHKGIAKVFGLRNGTRTRVCGTFFRMALSENTIMPWQSVWEIFR